MECPKCGNDNPVYVLFCMRCGHELSHKVSEIRAAVKKEVVVEENAKLELRLREGILLCIFLIVAAWAASSFSKSLPVFSFPVFTRGPRIEVESAPEIPMPVVDVKAPEGKSPPPPRGDSDKTVIRRLEEKVGKKR